jgi:hypothetical protein
LHVEFSLDLVGQSHDIHVELGNDAVANNVVVEGVADSLLASLLVSGLLEDLAETVPPATEFLGSFEDVAVEFIELSAELLNCGMVDHLRVDVASIHLDKGFAFPESFVCGKGSDNHLSDSIENPALPVLVVQAHFFAAKSVRVINGGLNLSEVSFSNVLIVFDELTENTFTVDIKVLREVLKGHDFVLSEINRAHKYSILNVLDFLLDVGCVLEDTNLGLLESFNVGLAVLDVLRDGKREPVVVALTLVHGPVQGVDLVFKEFLLHRAHLEHSLVVGAEELLELIYVLHVVLVLEGNVDDGVGDFLSNAVKELSLADDNLKFGVKIDLVHLVFALSNSFKNELLEHGDGVVGVLLLPGLEQPLLVLLCQHLGHLDVVFGGLDTEGILGEDLGLGLELVDGTLNASDD